MSPSWPSALCCFSCASRALAFWTFKLFCDSVRIFSRAASSRAFEYPDEFRVRAMRVAASPFSEERAPPVPCSLATVMLFSSSGLNPDGFCTSRSSVGTRVELIWFAFALALFAVSLARLNALFALPCASLIALGSSLSSRDHAASQVSEVLAQKLFRCRAEAHNKSDQIQFPALVELHPRAML